MFCPRDHTENTLRTWPAHTHSSINQSPRVSPSHAPPLTHAAAALTHVASHALYLLTSDTQGCSHDPYTSMCHSHFSLLTYTWHNAVPMPVTALVGVGQLWRKGRPLVVLLSAKYHQCATEKGR
jgi:hypothetical protein